MARKKTSYLLPPDAPLPEPSPGPRACPTPKQAAISYVPFTPTDEQRRIKAAFWVRAKDTLLDEEDITPEQVSQLLDSRRASIILSSWESESFRSWFLDSMEALAKQEYLFLKSLDAVEELLSNTDPKAANARVQACKLIAELGAKIKPRNAKEKDENASIQKLIQGMDTTQLAGFLEKNGDTLKFAFQKTRTPDTLPVAPPDAEEESP